MNYLKTFNKFSINEKLALANYDEYEKLVSDAYENAPEYDETIVYSYIALIKSVKTLFEQAFYCDELGLSPRDEKLRSTKVNVEFVDDDPYSTRDEMAKDVRDKNLLRISKLFNDHPIFTEEENLMLRAVHDYYTHIIANQDFGLRGELKAYNTHAKLAPPDALPALFTEIVGQACYAINKGTTDEDGVFTPNFAPQKICKLDGFDYRNVGEVEGREIVNKRLI
jgi:hypothetical protein